MAKKDVQLEKLGDILEHSLKRLDLSGRLKEYGIWPIWDEIVGATIARNAQPEKIRNGTLFVKVSSPVWMQQLQYIKEMITEKLNQSLGREVVKNLFFFVGQLPTSPAVEAQKPQPDRDISPPTGMPDDEDLESVKDPEIRRALKRILSAHLRKKRNTGSLLS